MIKYAEENDLDMEVKEDFIRLLDLLRDRPEKIISFSHPWMQQA